ncbi:MAG TPA: polysaccharide deacetylase family protein [Polyangiaceae bacterium]|jgi:hypothetical protein|nr:polysaccharide deacetylase family protein [Polyangiaceae bacterium]
MRRCAISVDLDEIYNYAQIHGLKPGEFTSQAVYDVALARLDEWSAKHGIRLTLFAVARDLERPEAADTLRRLAAKGHEIANHSLDHYYDLTRRPLEQMREQVWGAADLIERTTGQRPVGFRAPGYVTTDALYQVLGERDLAYSSSVFPCPWYYGAKAGAIGLKAALGNFSKSLIDDPRVLTAPTKPYRVGRPYWKASTASGSGILELPIQVTPGARLPFIGTSLVALGPSASGKLARSLLGQELINLELHGIDVLDRTDGLHELARHQPDLRIALERKLATLDCVVYTLSEAGYSFCTLAQAAQEMSV